MVVEGPWRCGLRSRMSTQHGFSGRRRQRFPVRNQHTIQPDAFPQYPGENVHTHTATQYKEAAEARFAARGALPSIGSSLTSRRCTIEPLEATSPRLPLFTSPFSLPLLTSPSHLTLSPPLPPLLTTLSHLTLSPSPLPRCTSRQTSSQPHSPQPSTTASPTITSLSTPHAAQRTTRSGLSPA